MSIIRGITLLNSHHVLKPLCSYHLTSICQNYSKTADKNTGTSLPKAKTPVGKFDDEQEGERTKSVLQTSAEYQYEPFPDDKNPETGEQGGPRGPEPTRYGDWERKGRVIDF